METFLENSMFLIVDDAEPVLPIFRSPKHSSPHKIVELNDVGCDTESAFSVHFPRSPFERRRGGAENFRSTRRTAKWRNERPTSFTIARNNFKHRNGQYIEAKAQLRDLNYDDVYVADLDYDSFPEDAYDDFELPRNNTALQYKNDYYAQLDDLRNEIERSRRECFPRDTRQNYSRDLESSPNHAYRREITSPRWFIDSNEKQQRNPHEDYKKRTKKTSENLSHGADVLDSAAPLKSDFWDFVSWENDASDEESIESSDSVILKGQNKLRKVPQKRKSYFYTQQNRENDINSEKEEDSKASQVENSRENTSPKPETARYRASRNDSVTRKLKILQSDAIASFPRVQSAQTSTDERSSNVCPTRNSLTNARSRPTVERRRLNVNFPRDERTRDIANVTSVQTSSKEDRCQRSIHKNDKFIKKVTNKSSSETSRPVKTNKHIVNLKGNERTYTKKERNNAHRGNYGSDKIDRTNISGTSRPSLKEETATNKRVFPLERKDTLLLVDIEKEKKRKFISKLPVRTWKRLKTREPAVSRPESDVANENANRNLELTDIEVPRVRNNSSDKIDNEACEKVMEEHATEDRSNVKRNSRFALRLFNSTDPAFSDARHAKRLEISSATRALQGQRNKKKYKY